MAFEHRDGICETCGGRIYRYPHPRRGATDQWAHVNAADHVRNPHDAVPRHDATCGCGGPLVQHPTLEDRWAHADAAHIDGEHDAVPEVTA